MRLRLPLKELPGIEDRDYWIPGKVNAEGKLEALQEVVGSAAVPFSGSQDRPIQIGLIYTSADVSDFLGPKLPGHDQASGRAGRPV